MAMSEQEIRELVNVGGVATTAYVPKKSEDWLLKNGKEIGYSVITDDGVEISSCSTNIMKIKVTIQSHPTKI